MGRELLCGLMFTHRVGLRRLLIVTCFVVYTLMWLVLPIMFAGKAPALGDFICWL